MDKLWKKLSIALTISLLMSVFPPIYASDTSSTPPFALEITYITGDWTVSDSQVRENETIVLTGNLTIQNGGHLTFRNVTLVMNCSSGGATMDELIVPFVEVYGQ